MGISDLLNPPIEMSYLWQRPVGRWRNQLCSAVSSDFYDVYEERGAPRTINGESVVLAYVLYPCNLLFSIDGIASVFVKTARHRSRLFY